MSRSSDDERGAVLVHVTIALIGLLAVSALTIDIGVKSVARGQAQNAADAGALAGATAAAFDDPAPVDLTDAGVAKQSAQSYALANLVWGQPPDVQISTDITFPPCPDFSDDTCIKVDVYRNQARQNPLPTFFARAVGVWEQGVRATATAQIKSSNATECLKPWAIVDRWAEYIDPTASVENFMAHPDSTFDTYRPTDTGPQPRYEPDVYVAPTRTSSGTGWNLEMDYGAQFAIKTGAPGNAAVSSGWFRELDLPRLDTGNLGGNAYGANIVSCNGYPVNIARPETQCPVGSDISTFAEKVYWAARGCIRVQTGVIQGQTVSGIEEIYGKDPAAYWDGGNVANSCCTPSPRIVPIAVMDVNAYLSQDPNGSGTSIKIVNIFGFFIEGMGDLAEDGTVIFDPANPFSGGSKVVVGRIMTMPGLVTDGTVVDESAAFLRSIVLVR